MRRAFRKRDAPGELEALEDEDSGAITRRIYVFYIIQINAKLGAILHRAPERTARSDKEFSTGAISQIITLNARPQIRGGLTSPIVFLPTQLRKRITQWG